MIRERMVAALADDEEAVRVLGSVFPADWADAPAVGRFSPGGVTGYRSRFGGPVRATRVEAENDARAFLDGRLFADTLEHETPA